MHFLLPDHVQPSSMPPRGTQGRLRSKMKLQLDGNFRLGGRVHLLAISPVVSTKTGWTPITSLVSVAVGLTMALIFTEPVRLICRAIGGKPAQRLSITFRSSWAQQMFAMARANQTIKQAHHSWQCKTGTDCTYAVHSHSIGSANRRGYGTEVPPTLSLWTVQPTCPATVIVRLPSPKSFRISVRPSRSGWFYVEVGMYVSNTVVLPIHSRHSV